ncbi:MAG: hypothetical protein IK093_06870 [Ruminiclostridium sp.]|nr:hypothetical protein [Ruminiclostridium sp.]
MNEQEQTIDLRVLFKVLISHLIPIVIVTVLAAAIGFSLAKFVVPKRYVSEALMYVENSSAKQEDSSINVNDINAAQKLVNTCQILFTSNYVYDELSVRFGGIYSKSQLDKMISINSVNSTEVLRVTVETGDPNESYNVACELLQIATSEFQRVIKGGSIETVSSPTLPLVHSYPSTTRFALIGAAIGLVLSYGFYLVKELLDTKVKAEDDLAAMYDLPVFAEILDFETAGKSGYKYSKYGRYGKYGRYDKYSSYDNSHGGYDESDIDKDEKPAKDKEDKNGTEK